MPTPLICPSNKFVNKFILNFLLQYHHSIRYSYSSHLWNCFWTHFVSFLIHLYSNTHNNHVTYTEQQQPSGNLNGSNWSTVSLYLFSIYPIIYMSCQVTISETRFIHYFCTYKNNKDWGTQNLAILMKWGNSKTKQSNIKRFFWQHLKDMPLEVPVNFYNHILMTCLPLDIYLKSLKLTKKQPSLALSVNDTWKI